MTPRRTLLELSNLGVTVAFYPLAAAMSDVNIQQGVAAGQVVQL